VTTGTHNSAAKDSGSQFCWSVDHGDASAKVGDAMNMLLADVFTLYFKTKNFQWHISGPHFREYNLLLDEQAAQLISTADAIAERVRKVGGSTLKSLQHVARLSRLSGNEVDFVAPLLMLGELRSDNELLAGFMRDVHFVCGGFDDLASMSMLEDWIDHAEKRVWFLFECGRAA
jgi:starvation-inducible DNA-binding protein